MKRFFRGATIVWVVLRFGLDELVLTSLGKPWLRRLAGILAVGRDLRAPRGQRLREALERLGPIFVKFGQVLSTRRDLMPPDIADELALLQDRVPPFDSAVAVATIERAYKKTTTPGVSSIRVELDLPETLALELAALAEAMKGCDDAARCAEALDKATNAVRKAAKLLVAAP